MAVVQVLNKKRKKKKIDVKRTLFIIAMLAVPILHFLVFFIYVNIDSVVMTFRTFNYSQEQYIWGLQNYKRFFSEAFSSTNKEIATATLNSLFFGLNDFVLVLISLVLSYFFFKKIPGRQFFRVIFFLPSIISIVIYTSIYSSFFEPGYGISVIIEKLGGEAPLFLADKDLARWLVAFYCLWVGTGYNILIFGGAMANINTEVIEYAKLDGVGMFKELFCIILPMIWPTLSVAFLGSVTTIFTIFLQSQLIVGKDALATPKTIAFILNNTISSNPEWAATIGICFTVVATPMILIVRKIIDLVGKKFGY